MDRVYEEFAHGNRPADFSLFGTATFSLFLLDTMSHYSDVAVDSRRLLSGEKIRVAAARNLVSVAGTSPGGEVRAHSVVCRGVSDGRTAGFRGATMPSLFS